MMMRRLRVLPSGLLRVILYSLISRLLGVLSLCILLLLVVQVGGGTGPEVAGIIRCLCRGVGGN